MSQQLRATYTSGDKDIDLSLPLPGPSSEDKDSVAAKTEHLTTLRANVAKLQDNVNTFLTAKMVEDNAAAAEKPRDTTRATKDEQREEDFYGEEVVDDE